MSTGVVAQLSANLDNGDSTPTYNIALTTQDTRGTGAGWNRDDHLDPVHDRRAGQLHPGHQRLDGHRGHPAWFRHRHRRDQLDHLSRERAFRIRSPDRGEALQLRSQYRHGQVHDHADLGVFVPQNSFAGTYTSTVTLAIVSGP